MALKYLKEKDPEQLFSGFARPLARVRPEAASQEEKPDRRAKNGSAAQQHPMKPAAIPNSHNLPSSSAKL
jgi:hypothetical protein